MLKLATNSISLTLGSYVATAASALTFVFAARTYGPMIFGSLSAALGISLALAAFADFGVNGWTIRALARTPNAIDVYRQTLTAKLLLAILLALSWCAAALVVLHGSSLQLPVAGLGGYLLSLVIVGTLTVPFRASENLIIVGVVGAVEKVAALGAWVGLQTFGLRGLGVLSVALFIGGAISVVFAAAVIPRPLLGLVRPSPRQMVWLWRTSYSFGLVGITSQILRLDVPIVNALAGPLAAGVYAAPARLTAFLTVLPSSFSTAVFPRIARSAGGRAALQTEILGGAGMLALMLLLLGGLALAAPLAVSLTLGRAYSASAPVLRVFLLVVLVNSVNQPLAALLQAAGHEHYAGRAVTASTAAGLLSIAVGGYADGATGAAMGALLMQVFELGLYARKVLPLQRDVDAALRTSFLASVDRSRVVPTNSDSGPFGS